MNREQIEAALEPFAKEAECYDPPQNDDHHAMFDVSFVIGDLRRAREALAALRSTNDEVSEAEVKAAAEAMLTVAFHGSSHLTYIKERGPSQWDLDLARAALIAARKAREI